MNVLAQDLAVEVAPFHGLLEGSRAVAMAESVDGRMCFTFQNQVQLHDGQAVLTVELDSEDGHGAPSNLRCVAAGPDASFWIGCDRGLWRCAPGRTQAARVPGSAELSIWNVVVSSDGDVWVRASRSLNVLRRDGTWMNVPTPHGTASVSGLEATKDCVWVWTQAGLWQVRIAGDAVEWLLVPGLSMGLRAAAADGTSLIVVTADGVFRVSPQLEVVALWRGEGLASAAFAAAGVDSLYFASRSRLWILPRDGEQLTAVTLYSRGTALSGESFSFLMVDAQGLLWSGTERGVQRSCILPGVETRMLGLLAPGDDVTALAEVGQGRLLVGSDAGRLITNRSGVWEAVPTPWCKSDDASRDGIDSLAEGDDGRLYVGTKRGLWQVHNDTWKRIGLEQGVDSVRSLAWDEEKRLWIAGSTAIWRLSPDGEFESIALSSSRATVSPRPCTLAVDPEHRMWLGAYREGLMRLAADGRTFVSDGKWVGDSVMNLVVPREGRDIWVTSLEGLWKVAKSTGARQLVRPTARSASVRSMEQAPDGSIWLALPAQLVRFDPATSRFQMLPPRLGSHPRGSAFRSHCRTKDGSIWFGATGGYTRILPTTQASSPWPARVIGVDVSVAGVPLSAADPKNPRWKVEGGEAPIAFSPRLVDRTLDQPPSSEIFLREHDGNEVLSAGPEGAFRGLAPGNYDMSAVVTLATGATQTLALGHLVVVSPPSMAPWLGLGAFLCLAGGTAFWRRERYRKARLSRNVRFDEVIAAADRRPEELLDIAFLSVATAEECVRLTSAPHASVWLLSKQLGKRVRVAELGLPCDDAEARARRCFVEGSALHNFIWLRSSPAQHDLVLSMRDGGMIEFELMLLGVNEVSEAVLESVANAAAPTLAALRKQSWITRLEDDFANRNATLEAEAHDLRSPLTALRMGAHELVELADTEHIPEVSRVAKMVSAGAERVALAVENMLRQAHEGNPIRLTEANPGSVVLARVAGLAGAAAAKRIRLETFAPIEVNHVAFDAVWYSRVVENVVGNAIKYTPWDGVVRVTCELSSNEFTVFVDDSGPGISEKVADSLILPGVIGPAKPTAGESQTGLGLWIARQAMRSMGGRLWISHHEGQGARVAFALPMGRFATRSREP